MEERNAALLKRREERSKAPLPGCTFTPDVSISRRAAPSLASSATVKTTSEVQPESAQASSESPLELVVKDLHNNTKSAKASSINHGFLYCFEECKNSKQSLSIFFNPTRKISQICDAVHTFFI